MIGCAVLCPDEHPALPTIRHRRAPAAAANGWRGTPFGAAR